MIAMITAGTLDLSSIRPETVDLDHVNDGVRAAARESMGLRRMAVCPAPKVKRALSMPALLY
jgi:hypothetical protein